jgi:hypothetical protein
MTTTARGLRLHHVAHVREPVEDVGALESARDASVERVGGIDGAIACHGTEHGLPGHDDERVAGDPDPKLLPRRELRLLRRFDGRCDGRGLRLGSRDGRVDLVVVRAAERGLERPPRTVEQQGARHGRERPGHRERDVASPALRLDRGGLVQARRVQEQRDEEADEGDDDRRACGVEAAAPFRRARAGASPGSLGGLHQNWK